jgi:hypothetical protein
VTHPRAFPDQSFDDHQAEMAKWMGCSVERMNADHDRLHLALCRWLGVPHTDSGAEEEAVLAVQRFMYEAGAIVP